MLKVFFSIVQHLRVDFFDHVHIIVLLLLLLLFYTPGSKDPGG